jgi:hypothetical protein
VKFSWHMLAQGIAVAAQAFNAYGAFLPPKWQALAAGLLGGAQLIAGAVAHFRNPDGTPAATPYTKP